MKNKNFKELPLQELKTELQKLISPDHAPKLDLLISKLEPEDAELILKMLVNRDLNLKFFVSTHKDQFNYSEHIIKQANEIDDDFLENKFFSLLEKENHLSKFMFYRKTHRFNRLAFLSLEEEVFFENLNSLLD